MTDPWSADFDDLRVFSLAMQNKLELSVCLSLCLNEQINFIMSIAQGQATSRNITTGKNFLF